MEIIVFTLILIGGISYYFMQNNKSEKALSDTNSKKRLSELIKEKSITKKTKESEKSNSIDYMKIINKTNKIINLEKAFFDQKTKIKLAKAGYRTKNSELVYAFTKLAFPLVSFLIAILYMYGLEVKFNENIFNILTILAITFVTMKIPDVILDGKIDRRKTSMQESWPDALDLIQISIQAGTGYDQAVKFVAQKIKSQSEALSEELNLLISEIAVIGDKRMAYESFTIRTGIQSTKNFSQAIIQAETQGTPIARALRNLSEEERKERMVAAEKKAAAVGPKLTFIMMIFFLPVIFIIIFAPIIIKMSTM